MPKYKYKKKASAMKQKASPLKEPASIIAGSLLSAGVSSGLTAMLTPSAHIDISDPSSTFSKMKFGADTETRTPFSTPAKKKQRY
jgi:CBS-domain-containing membrane protein